MMPRAHAHQRDMEGQLAGYLLFAELGRMVDQQIDDNVAGAGLEQD